MIIKDQPSYAPPPPPPTPQEPLGTNIEGSEVSGFDPRTQALPIIYGTRRVPGQIIFQETNGTGSPYLFQYLSLCEGTVVAINAYEDDGTAVTSGTYQKFAYFLGADGGSQAVKPIDSTSGSAITWLNTTSSWGTNHAMKGVASAYFQFIYNQTSMPRVPKTYFVVQGRDLTGNDDNPANVLKDYLTNTRYGAGISASLIDTTSFDACRDICDEVSDSVKRFTCNIVLDTQQTILANVKQILQTCLGQLHFINGKYYMHIDDEFSGTPVVAFDTSMIIGKISIVADSKNTRSNQTIVTWTDPNNQYKAAEVAWPDQNDETSTYNSYLTADNNLPLVKRVSITGCTSYKNARYLAEILTKKSRQNITVSMDVTAEAANCIPGDIVTLTYSPMSWSAKEFRITDVGISATGGVSIRMSEHQDSFYTRDAATVPTAPSAVTIRDPSVIAAVTSLAAAESLYFTREGAGVKSKVTLTWAGITDNFLSAYEVSYKLSSASDYEVVGDTQENEIEIFDQGIAAYDYRVISRAIEGAKSRAATVSLTTTGLGAQPVQIENFFINSMGTVALAQWDVSSDVDVQQGGHYVVAHSVDSGANTWDECVPISPRISGNQTSVIVPLLAGAYAIRATDSSNQTGLPTFFQSDGTSLQPLSVVATIQEDSTFAGTDLHTEAPDGNLKITSASDMDDISDVDAVTLWDAFGGIYNTSSDGYADSKPMYNFANQMSLGSSQRVRLRRYIKSFVSEWNDLMDSRTNNIDSWTDFDGTDASKTTVTMQMRSTTDDPASGSATWGEWQEFYVNELTARGAQFRIFPETTDQYYNIEISELRVYAEQLS